MNIEFGQNTKIIRASKVEVPDHMRVRLSTGIQFFDEALGSKDKPGFIAGSVFLFAGSPGSGKSTLCRQMASMTDLEVLMNVGEECFEQVKMALDDKKLECEFDLSNYRDIDDLLAAVEKHKYQMVVVDSLQNLFSSTDHFGNECKAKPGSNVQTELCAEKICTYAKRTLTSFMLICHSTKGGDFKGAQSLEHIIDATVKIDVEESCDEEGNDTTNRVLRLEKNRWGMTNVDFHLDMTEHGLSQVDAPERAEKSKSAGSTKAIARKLFADKLGVGRQQFIDLLVEATECDPGTACNYFYHLNRNRIAV